MAKIDRRDFVKLIGAGSVGAGAGFMLAETIKHPVEHLIPYAVPPEDFSAGIATWYNSVCTMCAAGCGISVRTREGRAKKIEGNPSHPVNQGKLCAIGQAGLQVLYNPDRLTGPLMSAARGSGSFTPVTWEEGLAKVNARLGTLRASGQGESVCFLSEGVRGQLANVFELFMEQLGSDRLLHYDFNHPQTLYAANRHFFGEDTLPYYDLHNTRYLLSFGADYLGHWISPVHHGLGFGYSRQGRHDIRGRFVQIEPRMSLSGAAADEWIAATPGSEGVLALGLAHHIVAEGHYHGVDRSAWAESLAPYSPASVAEQTDVPAATIKRLADTFAQTRPSLAIGGGAAGNYSNGTDNLMAVNALNYLVGNLGKSGGIIFNPPPATGQVSHPRQATYRAMLELAEDARQGKIDVLIISNTNPLFTLPAAAGFEEALAAIPLIVSLSSFIDDTSTMADLILPSHSYLESWGDDIPEPGVGFPVGTISQPVVSPLYNTRATGDIILEIAHGLGFGNALPWANMEECVKDGWRKIHERGAPQTGTEDFDEFWRAVLQAGVWGNSQRKASASFTLNKSVIDNIGVAPPEFAGSSDAYPFVLHPYLSTALGDGRSANLPWMQEFPDPNTSVVWGSWAEINPATAGRLGLQEGDLVAVESPNGQITVPLFLYPGIRPDVIAVPIGQGHRNYGRYATNRGVNPIEILAPRMEAQTGSLAWGATRVKLTATGKRVKLVKTSGNPRELGRDIVQVTGSTTGAGEAAGGHSTALNNIPITVVPT
jgi:anaerobic selenocysteine-containing dehydrogenase